MNPVNLTAEQRQLIINMADLWVRQNGIAQAANALVIVSIMQSENPANGKDALEPPQPAPDKTEAPEA